MKQKIRKTKPEKYTQPPEDIKSLPKKSPQKTHKTTGNPEKQINRQTKLFITTIGLLMIMGITAAYLPPVYIANPQTGECKYYFAGDERHFNPPPNGTWNIVGVSGEFGGNRSICQELCMYYTIHKPEGKIWENLGCDCLGAEEEGCVNWCRIKQAEWAKDESKCVCPTGMEWNSSGRGCTKNPGYANTLNPCSKEITTVIIKLKTIEKKLNQSKKSAKSLKEEFRKLKNEFSKLKENKDNPNSLQQSLQKIEMMLSDLEMRITESDAINSALSEVTELKKELTKYTVTQDTLQEKTTTQQNEPPNDSTPQITLTLIIIITLAGIYYIHRKQKKIS